MSIKHILTDIQDAVKILEQPESKGGLLQFKKQKQEGAKRLFRGSIQRLLTVTKNNAQAHSLAQQLSESNISQAYTYLDQLAELAAREKEVTLLALPKGVPVSIREEIQADIKEIQQCMTAKCYRSVVILCGRLMEAALHSKYYHATGIDLLEKAPGTGLGNLIAKLSEKGVKLDPGLTNQIHLINQVRIFSVHKKQDLFMPSKNQAEAIVLYTMDVLAKLF
ncbi:hypothetical protein COV18_01025 [Candidatus Woesearchaeota archaeon CG10_big_fil_rev_8_21_14_0_10_37_12]|nr:MAG: hypothetical protein COV18_01025 [Candidatus Woesearchaeota archaeon CG10_big_fil_rev_8_21_14_0_10_37_12]